MDALKRLPASNKRQGSPTHQMCCSTNRPGNQIVVCVPDHFDSGKFANRHPALHENPSVNVGRIRFTASGEEISEFGVRGSEFGLAQKAVFPGTDIGVL